MSTCQQLWIRSSLDMALAVAVCLVLVQEAYGQEEAADRASELERQRQKNVARMAAAKANGFALSSGKNEMIKAELQKESILRWSNPTVGSVYGEVFVWSVKQRPVAIASIYRWYQPYHDASVEFAAVSNIPVEARERDILQWNTTAESVIYHPIPEASHPGESRSRRLSQMRSLARRFSAELIDERAGARVERQLRLLNQPLHRYQCADQGVIDGALFTFVEGTDPEAWLILEAAGNDDSAQWRFALARMNIDAIQIRLDSKIVHKWPKDLQPWRDRTLSYRLFSFNPNLVELDASDPTSEPPAEGSMP